MTHRFTRQLAAMHLLRVLVCTKTSDGDNPDQFYSTDGDPSKPLSFLLSGMEDLDLIQVEEYVKPETAGHWEDLFLKKLGTLGTDNPRYDSELMTAITDIASAITYEDAGCSLEALATALEYTARVVRKVKR